jgi:hypothetical protein
MARKQKTYDVFWYLDPRTNNAYYIDYCFSGRHARRWNASKLNIRKPIPRSKLSHKIRPQPLHVPIDWNDLVEICQQALISMKLEPIIEVLYTNLSEEEAKLRAYELTRDTKALGIDCTGPTSPRRQPPKRSLYDPALCVFMLTDPVANQPGFIGHGHERAILRQWNRIKQHEGKLEPITPYQQWLTDIYKSGREPTVQILEGDIFDRIEARKKAQEHRSQLGQAGKFTRATGKEGVLLNGTRYPNAPVARKAFRLRWSREDRKLMKEHGIPIRDPNDRSTGDPTFWALYDRKLSALGLVYPSEDVVTQGVTSKREN